MSGRLFVISGPSGAGKSTIIKALRGQVPGLGFSISHTSRPPRRGELHGVQYYFVAEETFKKMIEDGAFVEWAEVYHRFYGTSIAALREQTENGLDVVLDIDSQGAGNIRKLFRESVLIYVLPPSLKELEKRLRGRGTDDEPVVQVRLQKAVEDIRNCRWYDYLILNENLDQAVRETVSIVIAERCRISNRLPFIEKVFHKALSGNPFYPTA